MNKDDILFLYSIYKPEDKTLENTRKRFLYDPPEIDDLHNLLHLNLSNLLYEFKSICDENNVDYFLMDSTLVSAIRSGRFIPWITDCKVGMIRSDYYKFMNIIKNYNNLELLEIPNEVSYLIDKKEKIVGYSDKKLIYKNDSSSSCIDIIIWDRVNIPKDLSLPELWRYRSSYILQNVLERGESIIDHSREICKNFIKLIGSDKGKYLILGPDEFYSRINAPIKERILKYDIIYPTSEISFMGNKYKSPNNNSEYIKHEYGDLWKLSIKEEFNIVSEGRYD